MASQLNFLPSVPPPAPLAMPVQNLKLKPRRRRFQSAWRTYGARLIAFGGTILIGSLGTLEMYRALGNHITFLQWLLLGLFSLTFYWVSFSTASALAGIIPPLSRREKLNPEGGKCAVVMPVYGEDPAMTGAALLAIADDLKNSAIAARCELFILSDTQNVDAWLKETAAFSLLRARCALPLWYRRRSKNIGRKAGNIEQFIKTWGGRYAYFLLLDADSLMSAETIVKMVARMDADPNLALLQTQPRLLGAESLLARTIQFAGGLYGKIVGRGISAWQGYEGNYWGHNALIRTQAFAESCGLPVLKGRRPIGGHIMSHDFVEAALLCRRGWQVRMDSDLNGSYEGLPPTLEELSRRERRWAQGNLQHLGIITARGLRGCSRLHFVIGIAGYLMSPIWLLMITVGLLITTQALFTQPEYFPLAYQLFPNWPTFDAKRMFELLFAALILLLLPKIMGLFCVLIHKRRRRLFGGARAVCRGFLLELLISTLYAPMMMALQTHHIVEIFLGRDSGWTTQSRDGDLLPWKTALRHTFFYVICGLLPLSMLLWLAPQQIFWLSPILLGLLVSPWLARHSGNKRWGRILAQRKLLLTPEEIDPPRILWQAMMKKNYFSSISCITLATIVQSRQHLEQHLASLEQQEPPLSDEESYLLWITASAKLNAAHDSAQALQFLTPQEALIVASSASLLWQLHHKNASADSALSV